jgi:peptidylprolyl isomerase
MNTKLIIQDMVLGNGAVVKTSQTIRVHYTGTLEDGTKFDSSLDRNQPFDFPVGVGTVIAGWDKGVAGDKELGIEPMKVGGKRKLIIPAEMGYGQNGVPGVIPPNATLLFDVEVLDILN